MDRTNAFLARGWAALTKEKNWWVPVLILGLVNCIPVVGQIFVAGYLFDWAKEAAWGMDRGLPHQVGDIAKRVKYGLYALVIGFVWTVPFIILGPILAYVPIFGGLLKFICQVLQAIAGIIACVAIIRALIYEQISPGLQFERILRMARVDPAGLARAFLISLLSFVIWIVAGVAIMVPAAPFIGALLAVPLYGGGFTPGMLFDASFIGLGFVALVLIFIILVVAMILSTAVEALSCRAFGYWVAQFRPGSWTKASDPMPFENGAEARPQEPPVDTE